MHETLKSEAHNAHEEDRNSTETKSGDLGVRRLFPSQSSVQLSLLEDGEKAAATRQEVVTRKECHGPA